MTIRVHTLSPMIPREWIAAHGMNAVELFPPTAPSAASEGVCPFAWSLAQRLATLPADDLVVLAPPCDQQRRALEALGPSPTRCVLHVPATTHAGSRDYYADELHRLSRFLIHHGGTAPTDDRLRHAMRMQTPPQPNVPPLFRGPQIAILGSHLRTNDQWIFAAITSAGLHLALDLTEGGPRRNPRPYSPAALEADPFGEMVDAHFNSIADIFRRPDVLLVNHLRDAVASHRLAAFVLVRYLWCDLWAAFAGRLRQLFALPVIEIDLGESAAEARARTRLESLSESPR